MMFSMSPSSARIVRLGLVLALSAGAARAQEATAQMHGSDPIRYNLTDLGALSGGFSQASYISNFGTTVGNATVLDGTAPPVSHATLWHRGSILDLAANQTPGLNSLAFGINDFGVVSGEADIPTPDSENFCDLFSGDECRAFR